jgi:TldD protein
MEDTLKAIVDKACELGASFADARAFESRATAVVVQDKRVHEVSAPHNLGTGLRVLVDGAWGFASTNSHDKASLEAALDSAISVARAAAGRTAEKGVVAEVEPTRDTVRRTGKLDPRDVAIEDKVKLVCEHEKNARGVDPDKIVSTHFGCSDSAVREIVCNSFGTMTDQEIVRTRFVGQAFAEEDGRRQSGRCRMAKSAGWEAVDSLGPGFSAEAAKRAIDLLGAQKPPAGKFPVIVDPDLVGLYAHEAFGHNAEGDHVFTNESILAGHEQEKIASDCVTIIDDSTLAGLYGSYAYDSEGTPGERRVLVKDGVLSGYLHDLQSAARLGVRPNGSGRAESHQHRPIVRMSNTYMDRGDSALPEMIAGVKLGLFCKGFGGGYVRTDEGHFTFNCEQGWMIRNGDLSEPLCNVAISGMTMETLRNIELVGDEVVLNSPGTCGKGGQAMFVDGGGPYLKIKELVVGGQR